MADDQWLPPPPPWVDPARRPRRGRVGRLIVPTLIVALVAAVVVGVASILLRDDSRDQSEISRALSMFVAHVEFQSDGYAELTACPIGSPADLARRVTDRIDLADDVVAGGEFVDAYARDGDYPAIVQCFVTSDESDGTGPTSFGVSVSELPSGSYRSFLEFEAYGEDVNVSVEIQTRQGAAGFDGDVFGYCYRGPDVSGCGADFVDRENGVAFSTYVQGTERTADEAVVALKALLGSMADALVAGSRSGTLPVTVPVADL